MPNPFTDAVEFTFEHDLTGQDTDLLLEVFDATGRPVARQFQTLYSTPARYPAYRWRPVGLRPGVYFYRLRLTGPEASQAVGGKLLALPN